MKLKLNCDLQKHKAGDIITIDTDENGVPLERYWRSRLKDSEIDNCVEIVKPSAKTIVADKPASKDKQ